MTHSKHFRIETQTQRGPATDLTVRFPDGEVIAEKKAADTFEKTIKKIGVDRVRQLVELPLPAPSVPPAAIVL